MRIAMLAPISWRTPPRHYGPWELVTSLLTSPETQERASDFASTVLGKRVIKPRLGRTVTIRDENARAAREVMSRFAVDPRWLRR